MRCPDCSGRWVALFTDATYQDARVSYHFTLDSLACPRCGQQGNVDDEVLLAHQRHPDVVATQASQLRRSS